MFLRRGAVLAAGAAALLLAVVGLAARLFGGATALLACAAARLFVGARLLALMALVL